jgi:hypothetical protein
MGRDLLYSDCIINLVGNSMNNLLPMAIPSKIGCFEKRIY